MASIPPNLPKINASNWPTYAAQGWRWVRNLPEHSKKNRISNGAVIECYQRDWGHYAVTLGQAWDKETFGPTGQANAVGVYVRDTEKLVSNLHAEIEAFEAGETI